MPLRQSCFAASSMKGDFSRLTFDPNKRYRSVLMQQGRVQLDADWNEQADILRYYLETQVRDILGPGGAPERTDGFQISIAGRADGADAQAKGGDGDGGNETPAFDLRIGQGRYYVEGILCENEQETLFSAQPGYPGAQVPADLQEYGLVYLDVWPRLITAFMDPALREIALGGLDTTTRVQDVWQVKLLPLGAHHGLAESSHVTHETVANLPEWRRLIEQGTRKGRMRAQRVPHSTALDNHLYRVEIHQVDGDRVTFKWSRENGAVVFAIEEIRHVGHADEQGMVQFVVTLSDLGRDALRLQKWDWVEIVDEVAELGGRTLPLYQVLDTPDTVRREVTLAGRFVPDLAALAQQRPANLLLCRWDHNPANPTAPDGGAIAVQMDRWQDLERGIQVCFTGGGSYAVGDYWLIPARALADGIEWPVDEHGPLAEPPHGVYHHYCPLALLRQHQGAWTVAKDLRQIFRPLPELPQRAPQRRPRPVEVIEEIMEEEARDLAEVCMSDEALALGDVVALVPGARRRVTRANRENARLVFGVVSGEMEVAGEPRFRVTIYGRARCKVTGRVEVGDLLTAAREDGCATKTGLAPEVFRPGAILGKALDAHEPEGADEPGMIEVLVTLQ
jgi:hypothetical protein